MKKAIQFGAGNIGRGVIGPLLSKSNYQVVFSDINSCKRYWVYRGAG